MATPQQVRLRPMTAAEQAALERITNASSARVDEVRRARALLAVAARHAFARAARDAGFRSGTGVANLVARCNEDGLSVVAIAVGRGRKPSAGRAARAQIVATAPRAPDHTTDGTATWSLSTRQRTLRRAAFPHLGATTIRRVREDAGSSSQTTRIWCPTGTAQRKRTAGVVTVVDPRTAENRA